MEIIVLLILGVPTGLALWLIIRSLQAGSRIEGLSRRLGRLEQEILAIKEWQLQPPSTKTTEDSAPARAPVQETPPPQPAVPTPPPATAWQPPMALARELTEPKITGPDAPVAPPVVAPPVIIETSRPNPLEAFTLPAPVPALAEQTAASHGGGKTAEPIPEPSSFEMRLGTYWLVRAGVVMLLTGLVFFGNFAWHNFIGLLGPGGKISLLYCVSAGLVGAGLWWQRREEKELLRNYAQVLFAGGLAAVYFTTYAAHHVVQLCVIHSATVDGVLLLAWAGFIAWIADQRKSEILAVFAVGLAYYTAIITNVGPFTLYSNLLLTAVGMFFLIRNRWVGLSFGSLLATYGSYAFWRFYHEGNWGWAAPGENLWFGAGFLISYWGLFTAAAFWSKSEKLTGAGRAGFITLNNGALFSLFLLTMLQLQTHGFWKFSLIYGGTLLGLSVLARRWLSAEPLVANTYLTQGLLLVTMGLVAKYAGFHLALVLGFESAVLLMLGTLQKSRVQVFGAYVSGAMAVGWGGLGFYRCEPGGGRYGAALGMFMLVNAVWSHRQRRQPAGVAWFRPEPSYFTLLALATWLAATWFNTSIPNFPLVLALAAVVLTFSIYILAVPEITLLAQGFLLGAQIFWISRTLGFGDACHWWQPALLIGITLGLSHWWQHQKILAVGESLVTVWLGLYALALVAVLYLWLQPLVSPPVWLALSSLLAVAVTVYGVVTRAWWLAAGAQLFLLASGVEFVIQLFDQAPEWYFPLAPILTLGILSAATVGWLAARADREIAARAPLLVLAQIYRWLALAMSIRWVFVYIPERERIWVFLALGLLVFLIAGWRQNREALGFGAAFTAVGLAVFWLTYPTEPLIYIPNLLALLAFLGQQQIARRRPARYPLDASIHMAAILLGSASLWKFLSHAVTNAGQESYLTASWAALALILFVVGIILDERAYRWAGLGILATALGRVVLFDVWKQETIYRILTFVALGAVLLVVGFIYNKYQDKIQRWL